MFDCAEVEGVPLVAGVKASRLARGGDFLAQSQSVRGHTVDVGPKRKVLEGDSLHSSVVLDHGINNPRIELRRV